MVELKYKGNVSKIIYQLKEDLNHQWDILEQKN